MATQRDTFWEKLNVDNVYFVWARKQENWIKEKQNHPQQGIKPMWQTEYLPTKYTIQGVC